MGKNNSVMQSYKDCIDGKTGWFFAFNPNLDTAVSAPTKFKEWKDWFKLDYRQKSPILVLSGFLDDKKIYRTDKDWEKLKHGYQIWKEKGWYAVYWGKQYLCNVFVGESLYRATGNKTRFLNVNNHYYTPKEIGQEKGPFKKRTVIEDINKGDIVRSNSGKHVEIITKITSISKNKRKFESWGTSRRYIGKVNNQGSNIIDLEPNGKLNEAIFQFYSVST